MEGVELSRASHSMMIGIYRVRKSWLWCFLTTMLLLTSYSACAPEPHLSQSALDFRVRTLRDFEQLTLMLGPAWNSQDSFATAGEVIRGFLLDWHEKGRYVLGLGVLDPSGKYLVGYRLDDTAPGSIEKSGYKDMNFASFKGVDEVVSSRKIVQVPLYLKEQKVLVVGAPLIREDRLLGVMCLSFDTEQFEKEYGISEQEFLKIDFNIL